MTSTPREAMAGLGDEAAARALPEIEALREFFHKACLVFWDGSGACEMDGADFEDIAFKAGLIRQVPYDPAKHGDLSEYVEPGDMIWEKTGLAKHTNGARAAALQTLNTPLTPSKGD